jgi:hypothetical protein
MVRRFIATLICPEMKDDYRIGYQFGQTDENARLISEIGHDAEILEMGGFTEISRYLEKLLKTDRMKVGG